VISEHRLEALERANRVRLERSAWKHRTRCLAEGQALRVVAAMVADPPEWALTMRLTDVLLCLPRVGAIKVRRLMNGWILRDQLRLGSMSERQRRLVIEWALERAGARADA
jgi:hypothetical protein